MNQYIVGLKLRISGIVDVQTSWMIRGSSPEGGGGGGRNVSFTKKFRQVPIHWVPGFFPGPKVAAM
jgi:hypothetical protein